MSIKNSGYVACPASDQTLALTAETLSNAGAVQVKNIPTQLIRSRDLLI